MRAPTPGLVVACLLSIAALAVGAQAAHALSVTVTGRSGAATISALTLHDNVLGNWLGSMTLNYSLTGGTYTAPGTATLGTVTGGAFTIASPAGWTLRLLTPFTITSSLSLLADGSIGVTIPDFAFTITNALGTLTYRGSVSFLLNSSGTTLAVTSSSFTNARTGAVLTFLTPANFSVSPAIAWRSI